MKNLGCSNSRGSFSISPGMHPTKSRDSRRRFYNDPGRSALRGLRSVPRLEHARDTSKLASEEQNYLEQEGRSHCVWTTSESVFFKYNSG